MKNTRRTCPGNCGKFVRRNLFACKECFASLPFHLRRPILATAGKPQSTGKAVAWVNGAQFHGNRGL